MTDIRSIPVDFITTSQQLLDLTDEISHLDRIAVDTETNSSHGYPERVCLIQIATFEKAFLLDPLMIEDMSPLGLVLANDSVQKVMHASDQDVRWLERDWGFRTRNVFDTSVAARFAGKSKLGLGNLLFEMLNISIAKDPRMQRSDWARRPLEHEAVLYAITDVWYLFALQDELYRQLRQLGRVDWLIEELARLDDVKYVRPDPEYAFLAMKGTGKMNGRQLAVAKHLFRFREAEAIRQGRPPYFVLSNEALIHLADNPEASLIEVPGVSQYVVDRFGRRIREAIREGLRVAPVNRPRGIRCRPMNVLQSEQLARLTQWRTEQAERLGIEVSLIWPKVSLNRLARKPDSVHTELASSQIRRWQVAEFGAMIRGLTEADSSQLG